MAELSRLKIAKQLIDKGELKEFRDIFLYVYKTEIAKRLGINYTRFLKLTVSPKGLKYQEAMSIARIIGVSPRQISELIHNQIEAKKK